MIDRSLDMVTTSSMALKIGPTVYPIVFAAIAARFMKKIASVKAERGTSLGVRSQPSSLQLSNFHSSSNN